MKQSKKQKRIKHGIKVLERKVNVYNNKRCYYQKQLDKLVEQQNIDKSKEYIGKYYYGSTHWPRLYKVVCASHGNLFGTCINVAPVAKNRITIENMVNIRPDDLGNEIPEIVFNRELDKYTNIIKKQTYKTYGYKKP